MNDTFVILLLLAFFPLFFGGIWVRGAKNHSIHGGWQGNTWTQAPYKIRRAGYIHRHFGSWEAVRKASVYKDGVQVVRIPKELMDKINADPLCHPEGKI